MRNFTELTENERKNLMMDTMDVWLADTPSYFYPLFSIPSVCEDQSGWRLLECPGFDYELEELASVEEDKSEEESEDSEEERFWRKEEQSKNEKERDRKQKRKANKNLEDYILF